MQPETPETSVVSGGVRIYSTKHSPPHTLVRDYRSTSKTWWKDSRPGGESYFFLFTSLTLSPSLLLSPHPTVRGHTNPPVLRHKRRAKVRTLVLEISISNLI